MVCLKCCASYKGANSTSRQYIGLVWRKFYTNKWCQFKVCNNHLLYYCIMFTRSSLSCLFTFYGIPIFHTFLIRSIFHLLVYITTLLFHVLSDVMEHQLSHPHFPSVCIKVLCRRALAFGTRSLTKIHAQRCFYEKNCTHSTWIMACILYLIVYPFTVWHLYLSFIVGISKGERHGEKT